MFRVVLHVYMSKGKTITSIFLSHFSDTSCIHTVLVFIDILFNDIFEPLC